MVGFVFGAEGAQAPLGVENFNHFIYDAVGDGSWLNIPNGEDFGLGNFEDQDQSWLPFALEIPANVNVIQIVLATSGNRQATWDSLANFQKRNIVSRAWCLLPEDKRHKFLQKYYNNSNTEVFYQTFPTLSCYVRSKFDLGTMTFKRIRLRKERVVSVRRELLDDDECI